MLLKNAYVLTDDFKFHKTDIEIKGDKISNIGEINSSEEEIDFTDKYIIPGLIDIHTHGAVGTDTMNRKFDFGKWQKYLFSFGVTTFFPSTVSESYDNIIYTLEKLGEDTRVEGINLEGPYLDKSKRGAHNEDTIRPGDINEFDKFMEASENKIKITTVAPEIPGNLEFIKEIKSKYNITVSAGHSSADYSQAILGFKAGAANLTHTFNAMNGLNHREPGLLGAALSNDNITCEVICDGIHLHPSIIKLLYKILGDNRMVLISDSMAATGLSDGIYTLGGFEITVKDGVARTSYGAIAGSTNNLMQMTKKAVDFGIPMNEAFKMATINPAKVVKIDNRIGSISTGKTADIAVTDKNMEVLMTIKAGNVVYSKA